MSLDAYGALRSLVAGNANVLAILGESADVTAASGKVYGPAQRVLINRLPEEFIAVCDTYHPPKTIVLRQAGGLGKASLSPLEDLRVQVLAYGEDDHQCDRVRRVVYSLLTYETLRVCQDSVYLHDFNPAGGPVSLTDPDIVWPAVSQAYTFLADTEEAA